MPTYSYKCKACETAFDVQQSLADAALETCETCGGPLVKVYGQVGVSFKGSGFYRNDSGANSAPKAGGAASKASES